MQAKDLPPPEDDIEAVAEFFSATLELPEESEEEDANEDAGEGAKAKEEEGKVGKEDSKIDQAQGDKIESKETKEKAVDNFMSGLDFGADADSGDTMGNSAAMDAFNGGLGGVIGAKGIQAGSGGLGVVVEASVEVVLPTVLVVLVQKEWVEVVLVEEWVEAHLERSVSVVLWDVSEETQPFSVVLTNPLSMR